MAKTIVIYYSYTGTTKMLAEEMAEKEQADLQAVEDVNRLGTLGAYTVGIFRALRMKRARFGRWRWIYTNMTVF